MSFISCEFKRYCHADNQWIYSLLDSDFGEIDIEVEDVYWNSLRIMIGPVRKYINRNLPVARNVALITMCLFRPYRILGIKSITEMHDRYCPEFIPNWAEYAKERDEYLTKLLPLL